MARFNSRLRFSLEEMAEELENQNPDGGDDTVVDVAADDAAGSDGADVLDDSDTDSDVLVSEEELEDDSVDTDDVPAAVSSDDVIVDTTDSVENDMAEVADAESEADDAEEQSEEVEEAAAGLESIRAMMISAQQRGGLSLQAARMANIAVESYASRVGIQSSLMPSMEAFGGSSSRLRATNVSIEAIGEMIKKTWAAIVAFFKRIATYIWNIFEKLFNASENLRKRAEKLVGFRTTGKAKSDKIKVKGLAKKIAIGTKADMNPGLGLDLYVKAADEYITAANSSGDALDGAISAVAAYYKGGKVDDLVSSVKAATDKIKTGEQRKLILPGNVKSTLVEKPFPRLHVTLRWNKLERTEDYGKVSDDAELPTLDQSGINQVGQKINGLIIRLKAVKNYAAGFKKVQQRINSIATMNPRDVPNEEMAPLNEALSVIRTMGGVYSREVAGVYKHCIEASFAYVQIAERSAAQYSGGGQ